MTGSLEPREIDLLDLDSVRRFATGLRAHPAVDLLVNNAGVGGGARALSPQGYERTWATNFLGPFALTGLLLDQLGRGTEPRVVHVSSNAYTRIKVELPLDDPAAERTWSPGRAYVASKLADLIFGDELQRRLHAAGSPVRSLLAHPGVAATPLQQSAGTRPERSVGRLLNLALGRSADAEQSRCCTPPPRPLHPPASSSARPCANTTCASTPNQSCRPPTTCSSPSTSGPPQSG